MAAICQFTPISYPEKHSIKITYNKLGHVIWRIYTTLRKSTLVLVVDLKLVFWVISPIWFFTSCIYLFVCQLFVWFHEITIDFFFWYFSCYMRWDLLIFIFQLRKSEENKWLHLLQLVFANAGMHTILHGDAISCFLEFRFFGAVTSLFCRWLEPRDEKCTQLYFVFKICKIFSAFYIINDQN